MRRKLHIIHMKSGAQIRFRARQVLIGTDPENHAVTDIKFVDGRGHLPAYIDFREVEAITILDHVRA